MLKFRAENSRDIYNNKTIVKRVKSRTESYDLESPKNISLEELQKLVPRSSEESNSLESLESCIGLNSLEELLDVIEEDSQNTNDNGEINITKSFAKIFHNQISSTSPTGLKIWKIEEEKSEDSKIEEIIHKTDLRKTVSLDEEIRPKTVLKTRSFDGCLCPSKKRSPVEILKRLSELTEENKLENWVEGLKLPKSFDFPQIREQIRIFLKEKSWEKENVNFKEAAETSFSKKMFTWFKELSLPKQILVIIGLSIIVTLIGFLTVQLFALLWPSLLGLATSGETILVEIGIEAFKQRQEPAFHLLISHAEQAKPLSYAWTNQYILWKYLR